MRGRMRVVSAGGLPGYLPGATVAILNWKETGRLSIHVGRPLRPALALRERLPRASYVLYAEPTEYTFKLAGTTPRVRTLSLVPEFQKTERQPIRLRIGNPIPSTGSTLPRLTGKLRTNCGRETFFWPIACSETIRPARGGVWLLGCFVWAEGCVLLVVGTIGVAVSGVSWLCCPVASVWTTVGVGAPYLVWVIRRGWGMFVFLVLFYGSGGYWGWVVS